jgi:hypothetical protein
VLGRPDDRVRVAAIAQFVRRAFPRAKDELAIERTIDTELHRFLQPLAVTLREHLETDQLDPGDANRLAFGDVNGDRDGVLGPVEVDVERGDVGVGKTAIAVERLDALQIGIEGAPVEIPLASPRQPRALPRLEDPLQRIGVHLLHADKVQAGNPDLAVLVTG